MHFVVVLLPVFLVLLTSAVECGQFFDFSTPPLHGLVVTPAIIPAAQQETLAHRAVVENAIAESQLPPELLNPFYKNEQIATGLAKASWFTNKEFPIRHREADNIPRSEIFKIIQRLQQKRR